MNLIHSLSEAQRLHSLLTQKCCWCRQVALLSSCAGMAGLPRCGRKGSSKLPCLFCTKKCQGAEPTRPGCIRKVSHLVSKNSRLKREETQMQVRWEEAVVLPVCEQFNLRVSLCCACTFLSPWINLISTCCLLALGAPKDQGSFRGINNGKLWFLVLGGAPASWALVPWESCARGGWKSGGDTVWYQTKQGLAL